MFKRLSARGPIIVMRRNRPSLPEGFEEESLLGEGSYVKVYLARNKQTDGTLAVKVFDKEKMRVKDFERLNNEQHALEMLRGCSRIVSLHDTITLRHSISLLMEYCPGGDVFQLVQQKGALSESEARTLFRQLIEAVEYMHSHGLVHRDIKLENLFLVSPTELKLGDFGLACSWRSGHTMNERCGTIHYLAPEMLAGQRYEGPEIDIWSLGVCLYVMVRGIYPFNGNNDLELIRRIKMGAYESLNSSGLSEALKSLIKGLLQVDRSKRLTLSAIKSHPWVLGEQSKRQRSRYFRSLVLHASADPDSENEQLLGSGSQDRTEPPHRRRDLLRESWETVSEDGGSDFPSPPPLDIPASPVHIPIVGGKRKRNGDPDTAAPKSPSSRGGGEKKKFRNVLSIKRRGKRRSL